MEGERRKVAHRRAVGAMAACLRLIDRLGGSSFALRKARVKEQPLKMAAELLDVYAARQAHPGFTFAAEWHPEPPQSSAPMGM